jgi:hypothetical protein
LKAPEVVEAACLCRCSPLTEQLLVLLVEFQLLVAAGIVMNGLMPWLFVGLSERVE